MGKPVGGSSAADATGAAGGPPEGPALGAAQVPARPDATQTVDKAAVKAAPERRIGPYRLVRELGHGGMGTVYLCARADDEYQKRVAIKVIRGADSAEVVRHFRRERQILAALEHPNIARLLDGGTTDDGLPYFVMEYIEGQPIDRFCDQGKLSVAERLKLFQGVCSAVQHAHRNLVIHLDIKPANILITAEGTPKLMDFGIARLLNPEVVGDSPATDLALTPAYASPEQVRGEGVSTTTDVYSLGVVLYEVLTGHKPYHLKTREPLEVMKAVCEEEPERPSTAIARVEERTLPDGTSLATNAEIVSRTRDESPERLKRRLRGDLDNIVLMALRKEPQRRYLSVEAFSEDIRRYLEGLPIKARKATALYQTSKFVRRNPLGVAAGVLAALLGLGFTLSTVMQSRRISRERDKAERLATFMVDLFKVSDPGEARGNNITAREILDQGAAKVETELKDQGEVQGRLQEVMARVYLNLGLYSRARTLAEQSLDVRRQVLGPQHADTLVSLNLRGVAAVQGRDTDAAEQSFREAVEGARKTIGPDDPLTLKWTDNLAGLLSLKGRLAEAASLQRDVLDRRRRTLGTSHRDTLQSMNNLAQVLGRLDKVPEGEQLQREALSTSRRILGNDHPETLIQLGNLGELQLGQRKFSEAEPNLREALSGSIRVLSSEHPDTAYLRVQLAILLNATSRPEEAEAILREAMKTPGAAETATKPLADSLIAQAKFAEAERLMLGTSSKSGGGVGDGGGQESVEQMVRLYEAWGKAEKAAEWRTKLKR